MGTYSIYALIYLFCQFNLQMQTVRCPIDMIKDIKCRTVDTLQSAKETGEQAECSLERGLYCEGGCHDYEISVYCQCGR